MYEQALGDRAEGTLELKDAVLAYEAALEEYSKEETPEFWAGMQNDLGSALWSLGRRETSTNKLKVAVAAYEAALAACEAFVKDEPQRPVPMD